MFLERAVVRERNSERLTVAFMIDLQYNKMDLVLTVQYNTILYSYVPSFARDFLEACLPFTGRL